jgi:D-alanyl-lipoteichoic acid acyltransferase DltB (MBOAT superfamily)
VVVLFPTITFAAFFMVVWPATWLVADRPAVRQLVLLLASVAFYAYWDEGFLGLLALTIVLNHACAHLLERWAARPGPERAVLWVGVGAHLAILGWFKYYGFFATSLTSALDRAGVTIDPPLVQVVLPLGVSFFTFQAISHLIEVHRGVTRAGRLLEVATWLSFFPTIAAGPITRPSELLPQLRERPAHRIEANRAFGLIVRGLFKKMVLASFLASAITDDVFANPGLHSGIEVLIGVYAYAAQLYLDFSGYTDMAIGLALLLGIRVPENFNAPYAAASVTEFWTRWHMTLSRWLRDFVFTPLALRSRPTTAATCRNLMIVMLLAGLWHGAAWTFVVFGAVHGVALGAERVLRQRRRRLGRAQSTSAGAVVARRLVTFHVVCLGWVFFGASSIDQALEILTQVFAGTGPATLVTGLLVAVVGLVVLVQQVPRAGLDRVGAIALRSGPLTTTVAVSVALVAIDVFGPEGVPPFLYFGF